MNSSEVEVWELSIRESVRQTLADYTAGTDRNRLDDIAACFAPTGVLEFTGGEPMSFPATDARLIAPSSPTECQRLGMPILVEHLGRRVGGERHGDAERPVWRRVRGR